MSKPPQVINCTYVSFKLATVTTSINSNILKLFNRFENLKESLTKPIVVSKRVFNVINRHIDAIRDTNTVLSKNVLPFMKEDKPSYTNKHLRVA